MTKQNALVLVSDLNYLERTKQVFYAAHRYGNWEGDYVLLACDIPHQELQWFRDRGIEILAPEAVIGRKVNGWPEVIFHKFFLLHPMMKKWNKIVYLDTDVIILRDINKFLKFNTFAACVENGGLNLRGQLLPDAAHTENGRMLIKELGNAYNLNATAFNVGAMVFNTAQNSMELFENAKELLFKYEKILKLPEQALFNMLFYRKWKKINQVYNDYFFYKIDDIKSHYHLKLVKSHSRVLHFIGPIKPWSKDCFYYDLWMENKASADGFPNIAQIGDKPGAITNVQRSLIRFGMKCKMYIGHFSWLAGQKLQSFSPPAYVFFKRFLP
ncbi:MAG: hypothetical protein H0X62_15580 [Bacteroidetes bacterium]|nr:hypothetical protein [Bacteroidota bacterium]